MAIHIQISDLFGSKAKGQKLLVGDNSPNPSYTKNEKKEVLSSQNLALLLKKFSKYVIIKTMSTYSSPFHLCLATQMEH